MLLVYFSTISTRYAIAITEKRGDSSKSVGWLDSLANDTHEYYAEDDIHGLKSGGPTMRVIILLF